MSITWPIDIKPSRWFLRVRQSNAMFQSPFTGQVQVLERFNQYWAADATFDVGDWETIGRMQSLIAQMRGGAVTVSMPVFERQVPRGTWSGTPMVTGISGRVVTVSGLAASDAAAVKAGDFFEVRSGQIVQVTTDAAANGSGVAALAVEPLPRLGFSTQFPALASGRRIEMRILPGTDLTGDVRRGPRATFSIKLIEAF